MKGSRIKEIIDNQGLKYKHVSKSIGVADVTLSRFLHDKQQMRESKVLRLLDFLGVER